MSSSFEALSKPVSEDLPSGENLEYDLQFQEMESLFDPPEQSGSSTSEERLENEPDWKGVEKLAAGLLEKTRDLRVQVCVAIASIHTGGLPVFRDNLKLLKIYLEEFWDSVHPQLDPDDKNDPTLRLNTLEMLNEHSLISMALKRARLVELKGMGKFGVFEVDVARGKEMAGEGEEVPDINAIRQAFIMTEPEKLELLRGAVSESTELLDEMNGVWKEKTGDEQGLNFSNTQKALKQVSAVLDEFIPVQPGSDSGGSEQVQNESGQASIVSGVVNSRADVVRVLDKICEYYVVHEPSSPIPLLLRRAQRLVEKSFLEILEDMVPDGVNQAKIVSGNTDE
jgi:type VI secretion system protein ImpA